MGKVEVNGIVREAKSLEGYIDEHSAIEVVVVEGTRISVKNLKKQ
jgi:membrane-bound ClpP family serine protease